MSVCNTPIMEECLVSKQLKSSVRAGVRDKVS